MNELIDKVAQRCGISKERARREIDAEVDVLVNDNGINYNNLSEMAYNLGLDVDDIMSNPEALLSFM